MEVKKSDIQKWVKALRSGEYKQTKLSLSDDVGYCCLGVVCKVFIPEEKLIYNDYDKNRLLGIEPRSQTNAPEWIKEIRYNFINKSQGEDLMRMNDSERYNFDEIADCLELVYIHKILKD